ncbi:MAG: D-glycero-beta-D-manno-heptose-7-phosphate kinase [Alphaproteobacteria bacterium]|nr:D-glycero-beta-D-manno-heptose-7-phosphate kinase [Alphaproteobacteria bacterium]
MTPDLPGRIDDLAQGRVLCVGDVMLDAFVQGSVKRISPEAPVPVLQVERETQMLGGAGNVARNITALGAQTVFFSVAGDDEAGKKLVAMLGQEEGIEAQLCIEKGRVTTRKTRYIAGFQHVMRADCEVLRAPSVATLDKLLKWFPESLATCQAAVLSDYAKGVVSRELAQGLIQESKRQGKPIVVDPKSRDFSFYAGAYIMTPNLRELALASGVEDIGGNWLEAAKALMKKHHIGHMLVTRGAEGATLVRENGASLDLPARAREVFDVSGAGDTVAAVLAVSLAAGIPLEDACHLANEAAGIVVGKVGTAVVRRTDLKTALHTGDMLSGEAKILSQKEAAERVAQWRRQGKKIGFTNGCFDLLHPGHVSLLRQAKSLCDRLVVGLNTDASVKRLKGESRPVQQEMARALVLASLEAVDAVVLFREDTPLELIQLLEPDVLVKGADYRVDQVVGADFVQRRGGKVELVPLTEGQSTTGMIARIA